jgi:hypothetical protein
MKKKTATKKNLASFVFGKMTGFFPSKINKQVFYMTQSMIRRISDIKNEID